MPDASQAPDILVLAAHPAMATSRVNRKLKKAARQAGARVAVRDLYRLYPDYLIDVPAEQEALAQARLVVWQHPIHWYGPPPLMKLWFDDVLSFRWAYGPGGHALQGKDVWLVASTGGSQASYRPERYNRYFFDAFLPPYEQTAVLCGMRFLPPLVLHGAHRITDAELAAHVDVYTQRLQQYPDWPEIDEMGACPACQVPSEERPSEEEQVA
jgi:glutathione-regulated potassium-efflux system ancillary protein KefF